jgi:transposase
MQKQRDIRKSVNTQAETRLLVSQYLRKKLGTQKEAALIFGLTERGVNKIWSIYKLEGTRGLKQKKRGAKEGKKLKGEQSAEVRKLIKEKLPDQLKLPYGLWTREAVQQLIEKRYEIELSKGQVGRYLKSWGYTPQKPIRKAFEQKPEKVKAWIEKEYPAIKKKAKKENAVIYFGDETGMHLKEKHQQ